MKQREILRFIKLMGKQKGLSVGDLSKAVGYNPKHLMRVGIDTGISLQATIDYLEYLGWELELNPVIVTTSVNKPVDKSAS